MSKKKTSSQPPNTYSKFLADGKRYFLCNGCDCPMLPIGEVKKINEYDHARGCPIEKGGPR